MTTLAVLKVVASILLCVAALACLLEGLYLWLQLMRSQGESYRQVAFEVAKLSFIAGALVSVTVFLWYPAILVLLVFLVLSLFVAWAVYQSVASPYCTAGWWRRVEASRKARDKMDEGSP